MWTPCFTVDDTTRSSIAAVEQLLVKHPPLSGQGSALSLRKANRIKTICSSLAIEGNTLSESEVTALFNGEWVVAAPTDVLAVRNAIDVYNMFDALDPLSERDLLLSHGQMMKGLVGSAGEYRDCEVRVVSGERVIYVAPAPEDVPELMRRLFAWLSSSEDHPIVRAAVFHYEFERVHPFPDGNGRIGRLWQSLLLSRYHPLFATLPVETLVHDHQSNYYRSIRKSAGAGDCGTFIEFMLDMIRQALERRLGQRPPLPSEVSEAVAYLGPWAEIILQELLYNGKVASGELARVCGISPRMVSNYLSRLRQAGLIHRAAGGRHGGWVVTLPELGEETSV